MKNILKVLIIFTIALSFSITSVTASELVEHDFNGDFTALAPNNSNFEEENGVGYHCYIDKNQKLAYLYIAFEGITDENLNYVYNLLSNVGFEKIENNNNLTIFKVDTNEFGQYGVGVNTNGKFVCIAGDNLEQLKEIGSSVEFNTQS